MNTYRHLDSLFMINNTMGYQVCVDHIAVVLSYIQKVWVFVFGVLVAGVLAGTRCNGTFRWGCSVLSLCVVFYSTVGVSRG